MGLVTQHCSLNSVVRNVSLSSREPLIAGGISQTPSSPDCHNLFESRSYARYLLLWWAGRSCLSVSPACHERHRATACAAVFTLLPSPNYELRFSSFQSHSVLLLPKLWQCPGVPRASTSVLSTRSPWNPTTALRVESTQLPSPS